MGSFVKKISGFNLLKDTFSPKVPGLPPAATPPKQEETQAERRQREADIKARRRGRSSTQATGPGGVPGDAPVSQSLLTGKARLGD